MVARKAKLAKELEGLGAMALSDELLLLDADRGSQGTELEEDCAPAVEDERRWRDTAGGSRARGRQGHGRRGSSMAALTSGAQQSGEEGFLRRAAGWSERRDLAVEDTGGAA
ncbi:hypothetical protein CFC21_001459 [Triticum aestivum]|uniref:Uncharacterized protein n=1 Tax=Triticum aestivum TaxID=4565 RepID=A0A3B5XXL1_WHEAT|nr:hypothetical protein CFC21_001459 [Triticum aestivum]